MKNKIFASVLALPLVATTAFAADLPSVAPPPAPAPYMAPPPVFTWTGFYAGLNAGASFGTNNDNLVPGSGYASGYPGFGLGSGGNSTAFTGGGQVGYNWQAGAFVFGVEADLNYLGGNNINGTYTPPSPYGTLYTASGASNSGYLGTVRGRVGLALGRALLYGTGGLAYGGSFGGGTITDGLGNVFSSTNSNVATGYAVGGGIEYALTDNWTVRAEYLYTNLGNSTTTYTDTAGDTFTNSRLNDQNMVRLGVEYKF